MADVVVTVRRDIFIAWISDKAAATWPNWPESVPISDIHQHYVLGRRPQIEAGERVYVVSCGKLRAYAPLTEMICTGDGRFVLMRKGGEAVTIDEEIPGFQGFRYRWWDREQELPFPFWRTP